MLTAFALSHTPVQITCCDPACALPRPQFLSPIFHSRNAQSPTQSIAEMYVHLSVPGAGLPGVAHWGREWHLQLVGDYPKPNK